MRRHRYLHLFLLATLVGATISTGSPVAAAGAASDVPVVRTVDRDRLLKGKAEVEVDETTVLVKFTDRPGSATARAALDEHGLRALGRVGSTAYLRVYAGSRSPHEVRRLLHGDPRVRSVELNYVRRALHTPNDSRFPEQRALDHARFPSAWDVVRDASGVTVAVIDSGVDLDHPDLFDHLVAGWDAVGDDAFPQDENGHGTITAGIIGATSDNGRGIAGAAYDTRLQPVRVLDASGAGSDADVIEGITWAADHGAKVISMSLGGVAPNPALAEAVAYARSKDVVLVAAAGNDGQGVPIYPAAYPGVLAVGAVDLNRTATFFTQHGPWVDLAATGTGVTSTMLAAGTAEAYGTADGTSFAAPQVAAAAALLRAQHPTWTAAQVEAQLIATARDAGPVGHDESYGYGLLDAYAAVGGPRLEAVPPAAGDLREPNPVPEQASLFTGTVEAEIAPEGDVDWFALDVSSPRWLTIDVVPPQGYYTSWQGMDPTLSVDAPDGSELGTVDRTGLDRSERLFVEAKVAGRYRIRVASSNGARSFGAYELRVASSTTPPVGFTPYINYPMDSWPSSTSIADLTGDGRGDVVLSTTFYFSDVDYSLFVFPQTADGLLAPPTRYQPTSTGAMNVATDDLDGDGDADLAVTTAAGVELFLQDAGTLHGPSVVPVLGNPNQVEVSDVDGDGRKDLVVLGDAGVQLIRRSGATWSSPVVLTTDTGSEIEVGDISGDGRPDFGLPRSDCTDTSGCSWTFSSYVQQPTPGLFLRSNHTTIHGYWPTVDGLAFGDVNGDGRTDATVTIGGNRPGSRINTFYQLPGGVLGPAQVKLLYDAPEPIEAADVNGDGRTDLVTAHGGWMALGTIPQQPDGTLGAEVLDGLPYASHYAYKGLALGDLDSVAGMDVAIGDYNYGLVVLRGARATATGASRWVRDTTPLDDSLTVGPSSSLTLTFGRAIAPSSISTSTVRLLDGATLAPVATTRTYDASSRRLTLQPTTPLDGGRPYQLVVSGVTDASGTVMDEREVVRFRTTGTPPPTTTTTSTTTSTTTTSTTAAPPLTTTTSAQPTTTTTAPRPTTTTAPPSPPAPRPSGYWMVDRAGVVYAFGDATWLGNASFGPVAAVDLEPTPSGRGYWVVDEAGHVHSFGDAPFLGGTPALAPGETVTSISRTPSGRGYWLFTTRGRVVTFGDAAFLGDMAGTRLNGPVLDSIPTPSGRGYFMVASDGGIFTFGDAQFIGSMGATRLNEPVQSLVPDGDGVGYWLVAADGGIFTFGADFHGSMGHTRLNRSVTGMVGFDRGYLMVAEDGGIFSFGDADFHGSLGASPPPTPVVSVARR